MKKLYYIIIALLSLVILYDVGNFITQGANLSPTKQENAVPSCPSYSKEEICSAIYIIEGGDKTKYPYGIKSVSCNGKEECKQICFNTVENNRVRYSQYGHEKYPTYLKFLQSRYCPIDEDNPKDLCRNWLPNLLSKLEEK